MVIVLSAKVSCTFSKLVNVGNIGTVRMKPDAYRLKAVTVKGMRRVIKNDVDRLQYLVGNDPFSKGMNGIEVMGRVPILPTLTSLQ